MTRHEPAKDTAAWIFQVWASFVLSISVTAMGIYFLAVDNWIRAFLWMGLFFVIGSCLSLAKTLRDNHEAMRLNNRISEAKAAKILRDYDLEDQKAA